MKVELIKNALVNSPSGKKFLERGLVTDIDDAIGKTLIRKGEAADISSGAKEAKKDEKPDAPKGAKSQTL